LILGGVIGVNGVGWSCGGFGREWLEMGAVDKTKETTTEKGRFHVLFPSGENSHGVVTGGKFRDLVGVGVGDDGVDVGHCVLGNFSSIVWVMLWGLGMEG
jgi:hypothetical protein